MRKLFLIGYEGRGIDGFLAMLKDAGAKALIDIREVPLSRKPGFSKRALAAALAKEGIAYHHFRELGSPGAVRAKVRSDKDYRGFFTAYGKHLAKQQEAISAVLTIAKQVPSALMCFEADAARCHRSAVAAALSRESEVLSIVPL